MFELLHGDSGYVMCGPGKAGIVSRWRMTPAGRNPDGTPRLRFQCQFSWQNDVLMGLSMKKRIVVQIKTKYGQENVDILDWDDWRYEGGVLTLENAKHFQGVVKR